MKTKKILMALGVSFLISSCFAQQGEFKNDSSVISEPISECVTKSRNIVLNFNEALTANASKRIYSFDTKIAEANVFVYNGQFNTRKSNKNNLLNAVSNEMPMNTIILKNDYSNLNPSSLNDEPFLRNKRNLYSSLWAFASLNYLYADLVGVMDKNKLVQYQTGVVEGVKITPEFLTVAAGFMQIPIANVFLPHLIKNEKTLRWVQIASGTIMTLVQSGTLFVGKPTPYYALFSAVEIAATTYITIDAIKWKAKSNKKKLITD